MENTLFFPIHLGSFSNDIPDGFFGCFSIQYSDDIRIPDENSALLDMTVEVYRCHLNIRPFDSWTCFHHSNFKRKTLKFDFLRTVKLRYFSTFVFCLIILMLLVMV